MDKISEKLDALAECKAAPAGSAPRPPAGASPCPSSPSTPAPAADESSYAATLSGTLRLCGAACEFPIRSSNANPIADGATFDRSAGWLASHVRESQVSCPALFSQEAESLLDRPATSWPPPRTIPFELLPHYLQNGAVSFYGTQFYEEKQAGGVTEVPHFGKTEMETMTASAKAGTLVGSYGAASTNAVLQAMEAIPVAGKHVLVIGTQRPWVEALALAAGAARVTTLEYGRITSDHPKLDSYTPDRFAADFRAGSLPQFDVAVSFSSLEHSGLGRYGDALNPYGDIVASLRIWCTVKPGGHLVVAVPSAPESGIFYNAHRIDGGSRWIMLLTNWLTTRYTEADGHGIVTATRK